MFQFLTKVSDLNADGANSIVNLALQFKDRDISKYRSKLRGKVVAMIFEKPSLRTKVAFEVAAMNLGMTPIFLTSSQILASGNNQQGRESVADIARNLERYADLLMARVYSHEVIEELVEAVRKPVVNALCDSHHPTQALADLMTLHWHKKVNPGTKVAYVGDGNNVATSLIQMCALTGIHAAIATPKGYEIPEEEWAVAEKLASSSGVQVSQGSDPQEAVQDADVVYTDTFVSMGQEGEYEKRLATFDGYQVNESLMTKAKGDAIFMHCLPAHRGEEVTSEVMDSSQSVVFDQAECRMHIAKSIYCHLLA